jgi:heme exporter protein C
MRTKILGALALLSMTAALYAALVYAPLDREQGTPHRIFYFHAPAGMMSYLAVFVLFFGAMMYLATRDLKWDRVAHAGGELGVLYASLSLLTGMMWAKPIWGAWFVFDARGTLQLILWLIFAGYLMLRSYLPDRDKQAKLSAVFGILGMINVPLNYLSIRFARTQHPKPVIAGEEGSGMEPEMWIAFSLGALALLTLFAYLLDRRLTVGKSEDEVEELATLVHAQ